MPDAVPVRRTNGLPRASFRFHLAMDTLASGYALGATPCARDFHPLDCAHARRTKKPPYLQMVSGSLLTLLITTIANHVGPIYSGILLFFPVIGGVLGIFYLKNQYTNAAIQLYKGAFLGKLTGWTFMLTLLIALPYTNIPTAYTFGLITAGLISVLFVKRARKQSR